MFFVQSEGQETVPIPEKPEDGPGPDCGGGPEYRHGDGRKTEGGASLVRVWQALLYQCAGTRPSHELLSSVDAQQL